MGNSTGSMFYAFGAFLLIYIVGVLIYQCYLWIKKWRDKKNVYEADADAPDAGASGGAAPAGDGTGEEEMFGGPNETEDAGAGEVREAGTSAQPAEEE